MDFEKVEIFVRTHWPAALMVAIIVAPSVWGIANLHFSERIVLLDARVTDLTSQVSRLKERVAVLDEAAARKLEVVETRYSADELFTPSPPLRRKK